MLPAGDLPFLDWGLPHPLCYYRQRCVAPRVHPLGSIESSVQSVRRHLGYRCYAPLRSVAFVTDAEHIPLPGTSEAPAAHAETAWAAGPGTSRSTAGLSAGKEEVRDVALLAVRTMAEPAFNMDISGGGITARSENSSTQAMALILRMTRGALELREVQASVAWTAGSGNGERSRCTLVDSMTYPSDGPLPRSAIGRALSTARQSPDEESLACVGRGVVVPEPQPSGEWDAVQPRLLTSTPHTAVDGASQCLQRLLLHGTVSSVSFSRLRLMNPFPTFSSLPASAASCPGFNSQADCTAVALSGDSLVHAQLDPLQVVQHLTFADSLAVNAVSMDVWGQDAVVVGFSSGTIALYDLRASSRPLGDETSRPSSPSLSYSRRSAQPQLSMSVNPLLTSFPQATGTGARRHRSENIPPVHISTPARLRARRPQRRAAVAEGLVPLTAGGAAPVVALCTMGTSFRVVCAMGDPRSTVAVADLRAAMSSSEVLGSPGLLAAVGKRRRTHSPQSVHAARAFVRAACGSTLSGNMICDMRSPPGGPFGVVGMVDTSGTPLRVHITDVELGEGGEGGEQRRCSTQWANAARAHGSSTHSMALRCATTDDGQAVLCTTVREPRACFSMCASGEASVRHVSREVVGPHAHTTCPHGAPLFTAIDVRHGVAFVEGSAAAGSSVLVYL